MFMQPEFQVADQKTDGTPGNFSWDESLEIAEDRKGTRAALTLSNISAVSSPPQVGESLQAFILGNQDIRASPQISLSLSATYVVANYEPAEKKRKFPDGGKVLLKPTAVPSNNENSELHHKLFISLVDGGDSTHVPPATISVDEKEHTISEVLQVLSHKDVKSVTSSTHPVSFPIEKQHAVVQGASVESAIVIDASGDEQDVSTPRRVRSKPRQADGVVMWTDPAVKERFSSNTKAIWDDILAQWMELQKSPSLEGMSIVVEYNELIIAASNSAKDDLPNHTDVITLRDHYTLLAEQLLSKLLSECELNLVDTLRNDFNRLNNESQLAKLITDHPMKDNKNDVDYRPAKRRKY
jgi:hypothetical protein